MHVFCWRAQGRGVERQKEKSISEAFRTFFFSF